MNTSQFLALLFAWAHCATFAVAANSVTWNCASDVEERPIDITQLSGYWYEAARVPNVDVLQCLNVSAPDTITANNEYVLDLEYISTVNGNRQATRESVSFPWDEKTQNGTFELHYSSDTLNVTVVYRLVATDNQNVALICGYAGISPVPLFKLFTRQRQISPQIKSVAQDMADRYGLSSYIVWEEQALDKCNAGTKTAQICNWTLLGSCLGLGLLLWQGAWKWPKVN